ncbi:hypothetical protein HDV00_007767 [Rhizophlyctis rosea]|nr:hypothetical protein HDV00_007767 [Rhizophlyctis rosea]
MEQERITGSLDHPSGEHTLFFWIQTLLDPIIALFGGIINNDGDGRLGLPDDFGKWTYTILEMCILVVVTRRASSHQVDGIARLMVELEGIIKHISPAFLLSTDHDLIAAWRSNITHGLDVPVVSGIFGSTTSWLFIQYDGDTHSISDHFHVDYLDEPRLTKTIVEIIQICWRLFLKGYCMALKALIGRCRAQMRETNKRKQGYDQWMDAQASAQQAETLAKKADTDESFGEVLVQLSKRYKL